MPALHTSAYTIVAQVERFSLVYDGEGMDDGSMEVVDLAPALLALRDLFEEAAEGADEPVHLTLRVQAGFRRGSFVVDLNAAASQLLENAVTLFSGSHATALVNALAIIGISGSGVGLIQLVRRGRGRTPRRAVAITETRTVRVEFEGEPPIDVDPAVWRMFRSPRARSSLSKIVQPLARPDIDEAKFRYDGREELIADDASTEAYATPDEHHGEVVGDSRRILQLVAMSFKDGNKWRVSEAGRTLYVSVLDEAFLDRVKQREVLFGQGDYFDVTLRTRQWMEGEQLRTAYDILQVHDHKQSPDQLRLFDEKRF